MHSEKYHFIVALSQDKKIVALPKLERYLQTNAIIKI